MTTRKRDITMTYRVHLGTQPMKVSDGYYCVLTPGGAIVARVYWGPRSSHSTGEQARDVAQAYADACSAASGPIPKPRGVF